MTLFWRHLDEFLRTSQVVIDRPKASKHPRFPDVIYPLDYGYLDGTASGDGDGIDLWIGSDDGERQITGVFFTTDSYKRDSEIKLLLNGTASDRQTILDFYESNQMGCIYIPRENPTD